MTHTYDFILFLAAAICAFLAFLNVTVQKVSLLAAAFCLFVIPFLIAAWPGN